MDDEIDLAGEAFGEVAAIQQEALEYLVSNLKTDQFWTAVASAFFLLAPTLVGVNGWAYVMGACGFTLIAYRFLAFRFYARGDVTGGLLIVIAGTWASTIYINWLVPEAAPITMVSVLGPIMLSTLFLPNRIVRRLIVAGVAVALVDGILAFGQTGANWGDEVEGWQFATTLVIFLGFHVVLWTIDAREANRIRQATVARLVAANIDLQAADRALRESRRRLVEAGDAERVRIERDLHDGAQQRLVALAVQLNLASQLAAEGKPTTADALGSFHEAAIDAVEELRELARGVYPAILAERGLTDALRVVARRSVQRIEVEGPTALGLDRADEATLYFVCLEALQNAAKHAGDDAIVTVTIENGDTSVAFEVRDDGEGFDPTAVAGSRGMLNMADRVGALGATLEVDSAPGRGTQISFAVPRR